MFKPTLQVCLLLASACFFDAHAVEDTCEQRQTDHDFDTVSLLTIKTQLRESPPEEGCAQWAPMNSCSTFGTPVYPKPTDCNVFWKWSTEPKYGLDPFGVVMCRNWPLSCKAHGAFQTFKTCAPYRYSEGGSLQTDIVREFDMINRQYQARLREGSSRLSQIEDQFKARLPDSRDKLKVPEPVSSLGKLVVNSFLEGVCKQATSSADCLEKLLNEEGDGEGATNMNWHQLKTEANQAFQEKETRRWISERTGDQKAMHTNEWWVYAEHMHLMNGMSSALNRMNKMEADLHFLEFLRGPPEEQGLLHKVKMDQGQFDAFKRMLTVYAVRSPGLVISHTLKQGW